MDTGGKILTRDCEKSRRIISMQCEVVEYKVNEKMNDFSEILTGNIIHLDRTVPNIGRIISVSYDKNNPSYVRSYKVRNKTLAIVILIISLIMIGILGFRFWMAKNFKLYAAAEGVNTTLNLLLRKK
jgi:hypothetical protein